MMGWVPPLAHLCCLNGPGYLAWVFFRLRVGGFFVTDEIRGELLEDAADFVFLYVTFPDAGVAETVARGAVNRRLCACANVWAPHRSFYRWKDKIEMAGEVVGLFKTTRTRTDELAAFVKSGHPFETPCIASLTIDQIDSKFGAWIRSET